MRKMIAMQYKGKGEPVKVLPDKVSEMEEKGWQVATSKKTVVKAGGK